MFDELRRLDWVPRSVHDKARKVEKVMRSLEQKIGRLPTNNEMVKQFQAYLGMALKAQAQCRATLEALAEIKNPRPVMFAKQANVTSGPQQVNNGTAPENGTVRAGAHPHARETAGQQNELLEHQHGNYLDAGTSSTAGGADPHLEAVEAGHRAAHA